MKRLLGTLISEYLPAFGLLLLTFVYLATAYTYKAEARAVPAGIAWVMVVLLVLDLVSRSRTKIGDTLMHALNPAGDADKVEKGEHYTVLRQIGAVLWLAGFVALMILIGILYAVPAFVFSSLLLRGRRQLWVCVLTAAGAALMIWALFVLVLQLELYPGILFAES